MGRSMMLGGRYGPPKGKNKRRRRRIWSITLRCWKVSWATSLILVEKVSGFWILRLWLTQLVWSLWDCGEVQHWSWMPQVDCMGEKVFGEGKCGQGASWIQESCWLCHGSQTENGNLNQWSREVCKLIYDFECFGWLQVWCEFLCFCLCYLLV